MVLYGNRAYEDALLELKNTAEACGFVSLAAGAFIGEHSFSGKEYIIQVTDDCDGCGVCIPVCPENAVDEANRYASRSDRCIYCCACIKTCPAGARIMKEGFLKGIAKMLSENCSARKEPETFFASR